MKFANQVLWHDLAEKERELLKQPTISQLEFGRLISLYNNAIKEKGVCQPHVKQTPNVK